MGVGSKLRDIRIEQGMSQETLAERLDVSRQTISKWENGGGLPSASNLVALSDIFGIPTDAFLKDDWIPLGEGEIQVMEIPAPRRRHYRLIALLAAVALGAGILIGAILFWERHAGTIPSTELESEVVDFSTFGETIRGFPPIE